MIKVFGTDKIPSDVLQAAEGQKPQSAVLDIDTKIAFILDAIKGQPNLMNTVASALDHVTYEQYICSGNNSWDYDTLPHFKVLENYRALHPSLSRLVMAKLTNLEQDDALYYLPQILETIRNTCYTELLHPVIGPYLQNVIDSLSLFHATDAPILFSDQKVWQKIEEQTLPVFYARTPDLTKILNLSGTFNAENSKYYEAKCDTDIGYLVCTFNKAVGSEDITNRQMNTTWVDNLDKDDLSITYAYLYHACHALAGNRGGALTAYKPWVDVQRQWLLPALQSDVYALEVRMRKENISIPTVPTLANDPRVHNNSVWAAHKGFFRATP
jgi:hypothetical protein